MQAFGSGTCIRTGLAGSSPPSASSGRSYRLVVVLQLQAARFRQAPRHLQEEMVGRLVGDQVGQLLLDAAPLGVERHLGGHVDGNLLAWRRTSAAKTALFGSLR